MQLGYATTRPIPGAVATAGVDERLTFIRKTYAHLGGAIGLFVLFEYLFLQTELAARWVLWAVQGWHWLLVLLMFMVVGYVADRWARSDTSRGIQYLGLGLYTIAEAIIMAPLLYVAAFYAKDPYLIHKAAVITLTVFAGLTGTVFITRKDFSFLGGILGICALGALGIIAASLLFGFALGTLFSGFMVLLAAGYILFYTSQVLGYYHPTQYVAASLTLFASVALLFWYVLSFLMSLSRE